MENLQVRILEGKHRIVDLCKKHLELYDVRLVSRLPLDGIQPPPLLFDSVLDYRTQVVQDLRKGYSISETLLQCPQSKVSYLHPQCNIYDNPAVLVETNGLLGDFSVNQYALNNDFETRNSSTPINHADTVGCIHESVLEQEISARSPPDRVSTRTDENLFESSQRSAKIQRSKSRQRAVELRNSANRETKSCVTGEKNTIILSGILKPRTASQHSYSVKETPNSNCRQSFGKSLHNPVNELITTPVVFNEIFGSKEVNTKTCLSREMDTNICISNLISSSNPEADCSLEPPIGDSFSFSANVSEGGNDALMEALQEQNHMTLDGVSECDKVGEVEIYDSPNNGIDKASCNEIIRSKSSCDKPRSGKQLSYEIIGQGVKEMVIEISPNSENHIVGSGRITRASSSEYMNRSLCLDQISDLGNKQDAEEQSSKGNNINEYTEGKAIADTNNTEGILIPNCTFPIQEEQPSKGNNMNEYTEGNAIADTDNTERILIPVCTPAIQGGDFSSVVPKESIAEIRRFDAQNVCDSEVNFACSRNIRNIVQNIGIIAENGHISDGADESQFLSTYSEGPLPTPLSDSALILESKLHNFDSMETVPMETISCEEIIKQNSIPDVSPAVDSEQKNCVGALHMEAISCDCEKICVETESMETISCVKQDCIFDVSVAVDCEQKSCVETVPMESTSCEDIIKQDCIPDVTVGIDFEKKICVETEPMETISCVKQDCIPDASVAIDCQQRSFVETVSMETTSCEDIIKQDCIPDVSAAADSENKICLETKPMETISCVKQDCIPDVSVAIDREQKKCEETVPMETTSCDDTIKQYCIPNVSVAVDSEKKKTCVETEPMETISRVKQDCIPNVSVAIDCEQKNCAEMVHMETISCEDIIKQDCIPDVSVAIDSEKKTCVETESVKNISCTKQDCIPDISVAIDSEQKTCVETVHMGSIPCEDIVRHDCIPEESMNEDPSSRKKLAEIGVSNPVHEESLNFGSTYSGPSLCLEGIPAIQPSVSVDEANENVGILQMDLDPPFEIAKKVMPSLDVASSEIGELEILLKNIQGRTFSTDLYRSWPQYKQKKVQGHLSNPTSSGQGNLRDHKYNFLEGCLDLEKYKDVTSNVAGFFEASLDLKGKDVEFSMDGAKRREQILLLDPNNVAVDPVNMHDEISHCVVDMKPEFFNSENPFHCQHFKVSTSSRKSIQERKSSCSDSFTPSHADPIFEGFFIPSENEQSCIVGEEISFKNLGIENNSMKTASVLEHLHKPKLSYIDSSPFPSHQFASDIPMPSPPMSFKFSLSRSSERLGSSNPELDCFPIVEEEYENIDATHDENSSMIKEISVDSQPVSENEDDCCKIRESVDSMNTESTFIGTQSRVKQILREPSSKGRVLRSSNVNQCSVNSSTAKNGKKFVHQKQVALKNSLGVRAKQMFKRDSCKHTNIITNVTSFIPILQQKQVSMIGAGKRDVKVKALEAAEASKRLEEERENKRRMKKESMKIKLEQEKEKKKKMEEQKRVEADLASKKRMREKGDRLEIERKRKYIEQEKKHAQKEKKQHTGKLSRPFHDEKPMDFERQNLNNWKGDGALRKKAGSTKGRSLVDIPNASSKRVKVTSKSDKFATNFKERDYEMSPFLCSDEEDDETSVYLRSKKFKPTWASQDLFAYSKGKKGFDAMLLDRGINLLAGNSESVCF